MMKTKIIALTLILGAATLASVPASAAGPLSKKDFNTVLENIAKHQAEQRAYIRDYVQATEDYNRDSKIRSIVRNINARQAEQRAYVRDYVQATEDYNRQARIERIAKNVKTMQAEQRAKISAHVASHHGKGNQMADRFHKGPGNPTIN